MKSKNLLYCLIFPVFFNTVAYGQESFDPDGYNIIRYENGQKASEGHMRNGKPDGYWITYYQNGIVKSEGNRKEFLLDSVWTFYNKKGDLFMQITYEEGKKNGIRRTILEDETIEETFVYDVKQGYAYHYYPSGKIKRQYFYEDGLEEGIGKEYSDFDGRVIKLIYYKKGYITDIENINRIDNIGLKQGFWKYYYDNGNVRLEGEYKNGLEHGFFKEYSEDGNLISTVKFLDGILQEDVAELAKLDIKKEYYSDGKVKIMASYKDGVPEGIRREYSTDGTIEKGYFFTRGVITGEGITDEEGFREGFWREYFYSGTLKAEGHYTQGNRTGQWKFFHPNGTIEQIGKYNSNGLEEGVWTWHYANGDLLREEAYYNGMRDGFSVEYDEEGNVITEGEYIENNKEGFWRLIYGDHREEGYYLNDMRNGQWKSYFSSGVLSFEGKFIDDNPNGKHIWYWPEGTKKEEGNYVMGLKNGDWIKYSSDGIPFIIINYRSGKEVRVDGLRFSLFEEDEQE